MGVAVSVASVSTTHTTASSPPTSLAAKVASRTTVERPEPPTTVVVKVVVPPTTEQREDRPLPMDTWTVVIQSRFASESGARSDVERAAESARANGYSVHVIDTAAYPSLRPGVIAAITGTYPSCSSAKSAAENIRGTLGTSVDSTYQRYLADDQRYQQADATKC